MMIKIDIMKNWNNINLIINNVSADKLENIKNTNIQKCINWCNKYKLPINVHNDNKYNSLNSNSNSNKTH